MSGDNGQIKRDEICELLKTKVKVDAGKKTEEKYRWGAPRNIPLSVQISGDIFGRDELPEAELIARRIRDGQQEGETYLLATDEVLLVMKLDSQDRVLGQIELHGAYNYLYFGGNLISDARKNLANELTEKFDVCVQCRNSGYWFFQYSGFTLENLARALDEVVGSQEEMNKLLEDRVIERAHENMGSSKQVKQFVPMLDKRELVPSRLPSATIKRGLSGEKEGLSKTRNVRRTWRTHRSYEGTVMLTPHGYFDEKEYIIYLRRAGESFEEISEAVNPIWTQRKSRSPETISVTYHREKWGGEKAVRRDRARGRVLGEKTADEQTAAKQEIVSTEQTKQAASEPMTIEPLEPATVEPSEPQKVAKRKSLYDGEPIETEIGRVTLRQYITRLREEFRYEFDDIAVNVQETFRRKRSPEAIERNYKEWRKEDAEAAGRFFQNMLTGFMTPG